MNITKAEYIYKIDNFLKPNSFEWINGKTITNKILNEKKKCEARVLKNHKTYILYLLNNDDSFHIMLEKWNWFLETSVKCIKQNAALFVQGRKHAGLSIEKIFLKVKTKLQVK